MTSKGSTAKAVVVSLALAALTLTVFARYQLRGPEGTINRYFSAISAKDVRGAGQLCVGTDVQFFYVTQMFAQQLQLGYTYRIVDVVRAGGTARAGLVFSNGQPMIIALRRIGKDWKIDLQSTLQPYRQLSL